MSDGGWNQNERQAGGGDDGVSVEDGEIAIDPTGKYLISRTSDRLVYADLSTGEVDELEGLSRTVRVTFDHEGTSLFLTRTTRAPSSNDDYSNDDYVESTPGELVRYDVEEQKQLWSRPVMLALGWDQALATMPWLDVTEDDRYVVVTYNVRVGVIDAATGDVAKTIEVPEA